MIKNFHKVRGKREFLFDDKELFILGGGAAVICVLILVLGIMIGQSLGEQSVASPLVAESSVFDEGDMTPEQLSFDGEAEFSQEEQQATAMAEDKPGMKKSEKSYFTVLPEKDTYIEVEATPAKRTAPEAIPEEQPQEAQEALPVQQDDPSQHVAAREDTPIPPSEHTAAVAVPAAHQKSTVPSTLPNVPKDMSDTIQVGRPQSVAAMNEPVLDGTVYTVQVASSPAREDSERLVKKFGQHGYQAFVMEANLGEKGIWYRVCVGNNLASQEAANQLRDELVSKVPQFANQPFVTKISE
ncbi:hypothetical protein CSA56_14315 [candidate division KSB3 bacterium]|uniref:SPOR domain-containing protein n=1 Tax=candidate division KSB3 bacterium TaxID=2044937 RepID=A0A2G6KAM2_9BACT|nr:MAG: hypothetical protein CSA56_14315 [candidate division KSB3 bacterium]